MKNKIIAVDFDGTLCENKWPEIGEANEELIKYLKTCQSEGDKLILWTCRVGEMLENAVKWSGEKGLVFDAVNENLPEIVESFGSDTRKIFANIYIDDRNKSVASCREKSGLETWAENELEIAKRREKGNAPEDKWDYGCSCYDSAYKAFSSLCEDGHSGASIGFTKAILNRLIETKPLTPIEDTEDIWNLCARNFDGTDKVAEYQCKRMSSLFKTEYKDGTVSYSNVDQCYGKDINTGATYTGGLMRRIIEELYPISMPYMPGERIEVSTEDFLTYKKNGDFDTVGIFYALISGEKVEINRFFAEMEDYPKEKETYPGWVEISEKEYSERRTKADALRIIIKKEICEDKCALYDGCQKKEEYQNNRTYCDDFVSKEQRRVKKNESK